MSTSVRTELPIVPDDHEPLVYEGGRRDRCRLKSQRMKTWRCCACYCCISCLVSTIIAVAVGISFTAIQSGVDTFVAEQVVLLNGSVSTDQFANPPVAIFTKFTFFTIKNPEEFQNGSKLEVAEVGPFVYRENRTKFNLGWNEDETILRYDEGLYYYFNETMSSGDPCETNITTINLPLIGVAGMLLGAKDVLDGMLPSFMRDFVKKLIDWAYMEVENEFHENLFITKTAHELLWGYEDSLLQFVGSLNLSSLGLPIPPDGKFGLQVNESITTPNMVWTGKNNLWLTGSYLMWNGSMDIAKWGTPYAGMLNGTEGLLFAPKVDKNDTLYVFVDQLFRSGYFTFSAEEVLEGIKLLKFVIPKEELASANQDPGFSPYGPDGVLNLTAVFPLNVPIFASKPHFLDADPAYVNNVSGLHPNPNLHDSSLSVEPKTGAVFNAIKRLQFNVEVKKSDQFEDLSHLAGDIMVPIVWVDEGGKVNVTIADQFKQEVYLPVNVVNYGSVAVILVFGVLAVVTCLLLFVSIMCYFEEKWRLKKAANGNIIDLHCE